jgi:hypothetical protein
MFSIYGVGPVRTADTMAQALRHAAALLRGSRGVSVAITRDWCPTIRALVWTDPEGDRHAHLAVLRGNLWAVTVLWE